jgi:hypothetical protein
MQLPTSPLGENTPRAQYTEKTAPSADMRDLSEAAAAKMATPTKMATPAKVGAAGRPASRKLLKQATFAIGFSSANNGSSSSSGQDKPRPRSESLDLPPSTSLNSTEGKGAGKSRRAQWTKQQSVHSDSSGSIVAAAVAGGGDMVDGLGRRSVGGGGEREWRGMNLTLLRSRIQRLIVVMNTSEPGSVPSAGMLASLVDLV